MLAIKCKKTIAGDKEAEPVSDPILSTREMLIARGKRVLEDPDLAGVFTIERKTLLVPFKGVLIPKKHWISITCQKLGLSGVNAKITASKILINPNVIWNQLEVEIYKPAISLSADGLIIAVSAVSASPITAVWNFGDSYAITAQDWTHVFDSAGTYTITLNTDEDEKSLTIPASYNWFESMPNRLEIVLAPAEEFIHNIPIQLTITDSAFFAVIQTIEDFLKVVFCRGKSAPLNADLVHFESGLLIVNVWHPSRCILETGKNNSFYCYFGGSEPYLYTAGTHYSVYENILSEIHFKTSDTALNIEDKARRYSYAVKKSKTEPAASGRSVLFDGTDDYISLPYSILYAVKQGRFTIELYLNADPSKTGVQTILKAVKSGASDTLTLTISDSAVVFTALSTVLTISGTFKGSWNYIAVCGSDTELELQVNTNFTTAAKAGIDLKMLALGAARNSDGTFPDAADASYFKGLIRYSRTSAKFLSRPERKLTASFWSAA